MGSSLALRFQASQISVAGVLSRSPSSAERLARLLPETVKYDRPGAISSTVNLLAFCVPDDLLQSVSSEIASTRVDWSGCLILHTSGVHAASSLAPFSARGGLSLAFHPIQTFPHADDPDAFAGCYIGLQGEPESIAEGEELARRIGALSVTVSEQDRPLYHLAASVASNFLVTLLHTVERIASHRSVSSDWSLQACRPLIERTIENVMKVGATGALTGPLVRGDVGTLSRHLAELRRSEPALVPLYLALARTTLSTALESGRISVSEATSISAALTQEGHSGAA